LEDNKKRFIFANEKTYKTMVKDTKTDAMERFMKAKKRKRECLSRLEKSMKEEYEKQTGLSADYFFAL
jgi:vacuolar-type H+-ATPase subunit H